MNIIEKIQEAVNTDDEDSGKSSHYLLLQYEEANEHDKKVIDDTLISICGWSLKSLLGQVENE